MIDYISDKSDIFRLTICRELIVAFPWKHFNVSLLLIVTYVARIPMAMVVMQTPYSVTFCIHCVACILYCEVYSKPRFGIHLIV